MKITVTERDIEMGERKNCFHCPIAIAVARHLKRPSGIRVYGDTVMTGNHMMPAPLEVLEFVNRFDLGLTVKPFSFELSLPHELETI